MGISISIVLYRSDLAVLRQLLDSITTAFQCAREQLGGAITGLCILVDNSKCADYAASISGLVDRHVQWPEGLAYKVDVASSNSGYGAGNNRALTNLNSDYHLVLNPDAVLRSDALQQSILYLQDHPEVGMLTPGIIDRDGSLHNVVKNYPECLSLLLRYLGMDKRFGWARERVNTYMCELGDEPSSVQLAGGCYLFARTELLQKLRGFDEKFFLYFEDFDLCMRMGKLADIHYVPSVCIEHFGGDVGRKHWRHHRYFALSAIRFFNRYGWKLW